MKAFPVPNLRRIAAVLTANLYSSVGGFKEMYPAELEND